MAGDDKFLIDVPGLGAGGPQQGIMPLLFADIIEPQFPEGAILVLQRPGELGVVLSQQIPKGFMIALVVPDQAVHVRDEIKRQQAAQAESIKRARLNGHVG